MGSIGVPEMIVIFIVALVMFGPKKLPELGKTLGKALTEFRRASNDLRAQFEREMHAVSEEHDSIKKMTEQAHAELQRDINDAIQPFAYADPDHYQADDHPPTATTTSTVDTPAVTGVESNGAHEQAPAGHSESAFDRMLAQGGPPPGSAPSHTGIEGTVARGALPAAPTHAELTAGGESAPAA